jgi:formylglycine-generating enzyme
MTSDPAAVRSFIKDHFNQDDFDALVYDFFPDVANDFTAAMTRTRQTTLLFRHCAPAAYPDRWQRLLGALERLRPEPYRERLSGLDSVPQAVVAPPLPAARDPRQLFLSHAHQDTEPARRLAADLQEDGWSIWIAPDSIRPGEMWAEAIDRGLAESAVFLVLLTPAAVASKWVRRETYMAIEMDQNDELRFLPLLYQPCRPPPMWRSFQWLDFTGRYEPALAALQSTLAGKVPGPAPPPPGESRPSGRPRPPAPLSPIDTLTPRQLEVLTCLARGMSNGKIAAELGINAGTVSWHVRNIRDRLNLADRTQVALYAVEQGLARRRRPRPGRD